MSKFDRKIKHKLGDVNIPSIKLNKPIQTNESNMGNFITIATKPCPVDTIIDAKTNVDEVENSSKVQDIIKGIEIKNKKLKKNGK
jgi:hypothetical protein